MIKFSRGTKKKLDKRRGGGPRGGGSVSSARSEATSRSNVSISSATLYGGASVAGEPPQGGLTGLRPSSSRTLQDLNASRSGLLSTLLSSIGAAGQKTFRSYKMKLPSVAPPPELEGAGSKEGDEAAALESDLELLGRTVHAVSSALTEPPKDGERYMIYGVSFNPKGCVWDALVVVQPKDDEKDKGDEKKGRSRKGKDGDRSDRGGADEEGEEGTFTFPVRVTCAEDDDEDPKANGAPPRGPKVRRAKTYAVDLAIIDDDPNHPISRWTEDEAKEHADDIKHAMEWVSYGIRRSMARSMFPQFPEGCQGKPFRDVYQLNKKLKAGTFSTVCRGIHRGTGAQVAVKCILRKKIEPSVDAAVFEEVLIMSGLHHQYVCPMIDYFEEDRCHFIVMEIEKGGDLCERINEKKSYSEKDARLTARNICEAMEFVHSKGFAHCDIKPRNYLLRSKKNDCDIRLADFGFAQHVHAPNSLTSQCGTPFFVAPEVINRKPYDYMADMWSIGVTCYLLLCGETPFNGKNRQQLFRRISCDEPAFPDEKWGHISDKAVNFVQGLLTKDPARRLSAKGALQHPWIVDLDRIRERPERPAKSNNSSDNISEMTDPSKREKSYRAKPEPAPPAPAPPVPREKHERRKRSPLPKAPAAAPPPQSSLTREVGGDMAAENARLHRIIKEKDAKIERLEQMVKRLMETEDAVHEC